MLKKLKKEQNTGCSLKSQCWISSHIAHSTGLCLSLVEWTVIQIWPASERCHHERSSTAVVDCSRSVVNYLYSWEKYFHRVFLLILVGRAVVRAWQWKTAIWLSDHPCLATAIVNSYWWNTGPCTLTKTYIARSLYCYRVCTCFSLPFSSSIAEMQDDKDNHAPNAQ